MPTPSPHSPTVIQSRNASPHRSLVGSCPPPDLNEYPAKRILRRARSAERLKQELNEKEKELRIALIEKRAAERRAASGPRGVEERLEVSLNRVAELERMLRKGTEPRVSDSDVQRAEGECNEIHQDINEQISRIENLLSQSNTEYYDTAELMAMITTLGNTIREKDKIINSLRGMQQDEAAIRDADHQRRIEELEALLRYHEKEKAFLSSGCQQLKITIANNEAMEHKGFEDMDVSALNSMLLKIHSDISRATQEVAAAKNLTTAIDKSTIHNLQSELNALLQGEPLDKRSKTSQLSDTSLYQQTTTETSLKDTIRELEAVIEHQRMELNTNTEPVEQRIQTEQPSDTDRVAELEQLLAEKRPLKRIRELEGLLEKAKAAINQLEDENAAYHEELAAALQQLEGAQDKGTDKHLEAKIKMLELTASTTKPSHDALIKRQQDEIKLLESQLSEERNEHSRSTENRDGIIAQQRDRIHSLESDLDSKTTDLLQAAYKSSTSDPGAVNFEKIINDQKDFITKLQQQLDTTTTDLHSAISAPVTQPASMKNLETLLTSQRDEIASLKNQLTVQQQVQAASPKTDTFLEPLMEEQRRQISTLQNQLQSKSAELHTFITSKNVPTETHVDVILTEQRHEIGQLQGELKRKDIELVSLMKQLQAGPRQPDSSTSLVDLSHPLATVLEEQRQGISSLEHQLDVKTADLQSALSKQKGGGGGGGNTRNLEALLDSQRNQIKQLEQQLANSTTELKDQIGAALKSRKTPAADESLKQLVDAQQQQISSLQEQLAAIESQLRKGGRRGSVKSSFEGLAASQKQQVDKLERLLEDRTTELEKAITENKNNGIEVNSENRILRAKLTSLENELQTERQLNADLQQLIEANKKAKPPTESASSRSKQIDQLKDDLAKANENIKRLKAAANRATSTERARQAETQKDPKIAAMEEELLIATQTIDRLQSEKATEPQQLKDALTDLRNARSTIATLEQQLSGKFEGDISSLLEAQRKPLLEELNSERQLNADLQDVVEGLKKQQQLSQQQSQPQPQPKAESKKKSPHLTTKSSSSGNSTAKDALLDVQKNQIISLQDQVTSLQEKLNTRDQPSTSPSPPAAESIAALTRELKAEQEITAKLQSTLERVARGAGGRKGKPQQQAAVDALKQQLTSVQKQLRDSQNETRRLQDLHHQPHERYFDDTASNTTYNRELQHVISTQDEDLVQKANQLDHMEEDIFNMRNMYNMCQFESERQSAELADARERLTEYHQKMDDIEQENLDLQARIDELIAHGNAKQEWHARRASSLSREADDKRKALTARIDYHKRLAELREAENIKLRSEIRAISELTTRLRQSSISSEAKCRDQLDDIVMLKGQLSDVVRQYESIQSDLVSKQQELDSRNRESARLRSRFEDERVEHTKEIQKIRFEDATKMIDLEQNIELSDVQLVAAKEKAERCKTEMDGMTRLIDRIKFNQASNSEEFAVRSWIEYSEQQERLEILLSAMRVFQHRYLIDQLSLSEGSSRTDIVMQQSQAATSTVSECLFVVSESSSRMNIQLNEESKWSDCMSYLTQQLQTPTEKETVSAEAMIKLQSDNQTQSDTLQQLQVLSDEATARWDCESLHHSEWNTIMTQFMLPLRTVLPPETVQLSEQEARRGICDDQDSDITSLVFQLMEGKHHLVRADLLQKLSKTMFDNTNLCLQKVYFKKLMAWKPAVVVDGAAASTTSSSVVVVESVKLPDQKTICTEKGPMTKDAVIVAGKGRPDPVSETENDEQFPGSDVDREIELERQREEEQKAITQREAVRIKDEAIDELKNKLASTELQLLASEDLQSKVMSLEVALAKKDSEIANIQNDHQSNKQRIEAILTDLSLAEEHRLSLEAQVSFSQNEAKILEEGLTDKTNKVTKLQAELDSSEERSQSLANDKTELTEKLQQVLEQSIAHERRCTQLESDCENLAATEAALKASREAEEHLGDQLEAAQEELTSFRRRLAAEFERRQGKEHELSLMKQNNANANQLKLALRDAEAKVHDSYMQQSNLSHQLSLADAQLTSSEHAINKEGFIHNEECARNTILLEESTSFTELIFSSNVLEKQLANCLKLLEEKLRDLEDIAADNKELKDFKEQNQPLLTQFDSLQQQNSSLQTTLSDLQSAHDKVLQSETDLKEERDRLLQQNGTLTAKQTTIETQNELIRSEVSKLEESHAAAVADREVLTTAKTHLEAEVKSLRKSSEEMAGEKQKIEEELRQAIDARNNQLSQLHESTAALDNQSQSLSQLTNENQLLKSDSNHQKEENKSLLGEKAALTAQNEALSGEKQQLSEENKTLFAEKAALAAQNRLLSEDKTLLQEENKVLIADKASLVAEKDQLLRELTPTTPSNQLLSSPLHQGSSELVQLALEEEDPPSNKPNTNTELQYIKSQLDDCLKQNRILSTHRDSLEQELQRKGDVDSQLAAITKENALLNEQLEIKQHHKPTASDEDELKQQLAAALKENTLLNEQLNVRRQSGDELPTPVTVPEHGQQADLQRQLSSAMEEIKKLTDQLNQRPPPPPPSSEQDTHSVERIRQLESQNSRLAPLEQEIEELTRKIETLQTQLKQATDADSSRAQIADFVALEADFAETTARLSEREAEADRLQSTNEKLLANIDQSNQQLETLENQLRKACQKTAEVESKLFEANARADDAKDKLESEKTIAKESKTELLALENDKRSLQNDIKNNEDRIRYLEGEMKAASQKEANYEGQVVALRAEVSGLTTRLEHSKEASDNSHQEMVARINESEKSIRDHVVNEHQLQSTNEALEAKVEMLSNNVSQEVAASQELEEQLRTKEQRLIELQEKLLELKQIDEDHKRLTDKYSQIETSRDSIKGKNVELEKAILSLENTIANLTAKLDDTQQQLSSTLETLHSSEQQVSELTTQLEQSTDECSSLGVEIASLKESEEELKKLKSQQAIEISELSNKLAQQADDIDDLKIKVETTERERDTSAGIQHDFEESARIAEERAAVAEEALSSNESQVIKLIELATAAEVMNEEKDNEISKLQQEIANHNLQHQMLSQDRDAQRKAADSSSARISELRTEITRLNTVIDDLQKSKVALTSLQLETDALRSQISQLRETESKLSKQLHSTDSHLADQKLKLTTAEGTIAQLTATQKTLRATISDFENGQTDLRKQQHELSTKCKSLESSLAEAEKEVRALTEKLQLAESENQEASEKLVVLSQQHEESAVSVTTLSKQLSEKSSELEKMTRELSFARARLASHPLPAFDDDQPTDLMMLLQEVG